MSRAVLRSRMFRSAVYGEFAMNASASKAVVVEPRAEEPFPASRTREHVVAEPGDAKVQHPQDGKYKAWFVGVEEPLG
jgi:hypothetical protein